MARKIKEKIISEVAKELNLSHQEVSNVINSLNSFIERMIRNEDPKGIWIRGFGTIIYNHAKKRKIVEKTEAKKRREQNGV